MSTFLTFKFTEFGAIHKISSIYFLRQIFFVRQNMRPFYTIGFKHTLIDTRQIICKFLVNIQLALRFVFQNRRMLKLC